MTDPANPIDGADRSDSSGPSSEIPVTDLPAYVPERRGEAQRPRRRPTVRKADKPLVVMLTWMLVVAGGIVGVAAVGTRAGASSPEGAVERLLGALSQEDLLGAVEALTSAEREALVGVGPLVDELERVGVLTDVDPRAVAGVDFEFSDLTFAREEVLAGVTAVRVVGGHFRASYTCATLPISRELLGDDFDEECEDESDDVDLADEDLLLAAVDTGDGWYVSLGYTMAEYSRRDAELPVPTGEGRPAPIGSDTPEGAVRGLIEAGEDLDVRRAIGMLDPEEMAPLYDYSPLYLDEWEASEDGTEIEVHRLDLGEAAGSGNVRSVPVMAYDIEWIDEDLRQRRVLADGCLEVTAVWSDGYEEDASEVCRDELGQRPPRDGYGLFWSSGFDEMQLSLRVVVVERDGRWYVSPTRTAFDSMLVFLGSVEDGAMVDWFGWFFGYESEARFEAVGCAISGSGEPVEEDDCEWEAEAPGSMELDEGFETYDEEDDYYRLEEAALGCADAFWEAVGGLEAGPEGVATVIDLALEHDDCVRSVALELGDDPDQTLDDFGLWVVDDCLSDGTEGIDPTDPALLACLEWSLDVDLDGDGLLDADGRPNITTTTSTPASTPPTSAPPTSTPFGPGSSDPNPSTPSGGEGAGATPATTTVVSD